MMTIIFPVLSFIGCILASYKIGRMAEKKKNILQLLEAEKNHTEIMAKAMKQREEIYEENKEIRKQLDRSINGGDVPVNDVIVLLDKIRNIKDSKTD